MAAGESRTDAEGPASVGISQTQGMYPRGKICSCWHVGFTPPVIAGPPSCRQGQSHRANLAHPQ